MRGTVDSVRLIYLGGYLTADAATSATSITVDSVTDFNEGGGILLLNAVQYTYTAADFTTNIITLASGLTGAATSGQRVDVYPLTPEKQALVMVSGGEDVLTARVPHSLFDRMPEGIRTPATAESVEFVDYGAAGGELVITDVVGKAPVIDASYVDTTLGPVSDGAAPAAAPVNILILGGPGMLFVNWSGITNADPVSYEIHVSKTSGFTPGSGTLLATTTDTSYTIRKLPGTIPTPPAADTTALVYGTTYYVKIRPLDVDGFGPYSSQASGTMVQITGPAIAPASVTTTKIVTGSITGDLFAAQILLASTIKTGTSGQRWEGDNLGIRLYDPTGTVAVNLPTGTGEIAKFSGAGEFDSLTVNDRLTIGGTSNAIDTGAGVAMSTGIVKPSSAPTRTVEWESLQLDVTTTRSATSGPDLWGTRAPDPEGFQHILFEGTTTLWVVENFLSGVDNEGSRIWKYDLTTGAHTACYDWVHYVTSLTLWGGVYYVMWTQTWNAWYVTDCTTVPSELNSYLGSYVTNLSLSHSRDICIGNNSTSLVLSDVDDSTGQLWIRAFTLPGSTGPVTITSNAVGDTSVSFSTSNFAPNFLLWGTFDFGATRYVSAAARTAYNFHTMTAANPGVWQPNEEWPCPTSDKRGTGWDGTRFWTLGPAGKLYKHTTIIWTTESPNWWLAHTWNDTVGADETDLGTMGMVVAYKRARVRVSIPALPAGTTGWKVYWNRNATQPASTTMHLQSTVTGPTLTYYIDTLATAGAAPPITNNFPAATPGYHRAAALDGSGNPKVDLRGDGFAYFAELRTPILTAAQSRTTRPRTYLATNTTRSIANVTETLVQWDGPGPNDGITASAVTDDITIIYPGYYLIEFNPTWASFGPSSSATATYIYKNAAKLAEVVSVGINAIALLAANDVITFKVYQGTGAAVNLSAGTIAWIQWEGP